MCCDDYHNKRQNTSMKAIKVINAQFDEKSKCSVCTEVCCKGKNKKITKMQLPQDVYADIIQ